jgi:EPS-associated MarR family transcriptional regulator
MASIRKERQQENYFKVMRLFKEEPSILTRQIANRIGISNGAAYYCVNTLVEKGFVKFKNFAQSKINISCIYELTLRGISAKAALVVQFLECKKDEYSQLKAEIEGLENDFGLIDEDVTDDSRGSL